jgi:hypothetical protein
MDTESKERVVFEQVEGVGEAAREAIRDNELDGPNEGRPLATQVSILLFWCGVKGRTYLKASHFSDSKHFRSFL